MSLAHTVLTESAGLAKTSSLVNPNFFDGMKIGLFPLTMIGGALVVVGAIRLLAQTHIGFVTVAEGTTVIVTDFGKFRTCFMSYSDRLFRHQIEHLGMNNHHYTELSELDDKDLDPWDVLELTKDGMKYLKNHPEGSRILGRSGLRVFGFPLVHEIYSKRFTWTSYEQGKEASNEPVFNQQIISYTFLKEDVYASDIPSAETQEVLPVKLRIFITGRVVNPKKAAFNVEHFLEATQNQVRAAIREYIGTLSYLKLTTKSEESNEEDEAAGLTEERLMDMLSREVQRRRRNVQNILYTVLARYGFYISRVQVFNVDPDEQYRNLTMLKYRGEQEKKRLSQLEKFGDFGKTVLALDTLRDRENTTKLNLFLNGDSLAPVTPTIPIEGSESKQADKSSEKKDTEEVSNA